MSSTCQSHIDGFNDVDLNAISLKYSKNMLRLTDSEKTFPVNSVKDVVRSSV